MKKIIITLLALPLFFGCGGNSETETDPVKDSLNALTGELNGKINQKDSTIGSFISAFNEIQDNLNQIKEKEKIIANISKDGDVKSKEEQIKEDIQLIYDLMEKNKQRVASLNSKLKKANVRAGELEKMIANLQTMVAEKDAEILTLKAQLESLNLDIANIQANLQEVKQESDLKTEKLNTVYYAFGTAKELITQNVLTKEGGFIGIGKSTKLSDNFNKDYFTKVDASNTKEITLACKKAKVVTSHPSSSYKIVGEQGKKIEKLVIENSADFWGTSKYLVVVVE